MEGVGLKEQKTGQKTGHCMRREEVGGTVVVEEESRREADKLDKDMFQYYQRTAGSTPPPLHSLNSNRDEDHTTDDHIGI